MSLHINTFDELKPNAILQTTVHVDCSLVFLFNFDQIKILTYRKGISLQKPTQRSVKETHYQNYKCCCSVLSLDNVHSPDYQTKKKKKMFSTEIVVRKYRIFENVKYFV